MPIRYRIDHQAKVVVAAGYGTLTDAELFGYQREVWSRDDVAGFDELADMTGVEHIALPSPERLRDLAATAAAMDYPSRRCRLAIVAPSDAVFGLGRMFQVRREQDPHSKKQVEVFRTMAEALQFLQLDHLLALPAPDGGPSI